MAASSAVARATRAGGQHHRLALVLPVRLKDTKANLYHGTFNCRLRPTPVKREWRAGDPASSISGMRAGPYAPGLAIELKRGMQRVPQVCLRHCNLRHCNL